jgi:hypothetical protein
LVILIAGATTDGTRTGREGCEKHAPVTLQAHGDRQVEVCHLHTIRREAEYVNRLDDPRIHQRTIAYFSGSLHVHAIFNENTAEHIRVQPTRYIMRFVPLPINEHSGGVGCAVAAVVADAMPSLSVMVMVVLLGVPSVYAASACKVSTTISADSAVVSFTG